MLSRIEMRLKPDSADVTSVLRLEQYLLMSLVVEETAVRRKHRNSENTETSVQPEKTRLCFSLQRLCFKFFFPAAHQHMYGRLGCYHSNPYSSVSPECWRENSTNQIWSLQANEAWDTSDQFIEFFTSEMFRVKVVPVIFGGEVSRDT